MKRKIRILVILFAVMGLSNMVNAEVIHIYMSESIDGNTYYRNNIGDTFVLHWGGDPSGANDPGVWDWDWYDSGGHFDGDPNETTTLGADFVDGVFYDQSSTETGYSYNVTFYIEDPVINTYDVTFNVTDNATGDPINGASVTFDGTAQSTNSSGVTVFNDYEDGTYSYSVVKSGYDTETGSVTVSGANVTKNVTMTETTASTYDVTFNVNASAKSIVGATVSLTGYGDQVTDGSGNCTFTGVPDGTYSYSVVASGYQNASGSVTVNGANVTKNVYMDPLGIGDVDGVSVSVYPNPCVDYLIIDSQNHNVQWAVYSIIGQFVKAGDGNRIGMSNLNAGYYMLKIKTDEGSVIKKILKR